MKSKKKITLILIIITVIFLIPTQVFASSDIAKITIISDGSGIGGKHAFLLVENLSSKPIKIGNYTLKKNTEVTIGTWGNKYEHKGIWYNLEGYFINNANSYSNRVSLSKNINKKELDKITKNLNKRDNWSYFNNCSSFASSIWNTISTDENKLYAGTFFNKPSTLSESIKSKKDYKQNIKIIKPKKSDIAYSDKNKIKKPSFSLF